MYAVKQFQFYRIYMTNFRHFTVTEYLQTLPCEIRVSHTNEYEDSVFWDTTPQSG